MSNPLTFLRDFDMESPIRMFLDYDGTLADFALTPDVVTPDPDLILLLSEINSYSNIHPIILSGRKLAHLKGLLPINGLHICGTYGIEMLLPNGEMSCQGNFQKNHIKMLELEGILREQVPECEKIYIENKGAAIAIHLKDIAEDTSSIITQKIVGIICKQFKDPAYILNRNQNFIEYAPLEANKALTVSKILKDNRQEASMNIYIGDDEKDEEAMKIINAVNGISIRVSDLPIISSATYRLKNPFEVRTWLYCFLQARKNNVH